MAQTLQQQLQNKAGEMVACLEFIKLNIKSNSKYGNIANGKNKLKKRNVIFQKIVSLCVISSAIIFIIYITNL